MSFIDFEEVKAANPIENVAERLGLGLKKNGSQLRGPCPSGEGGPRALVITPAKGVWYSFALKQGGDVLALVQLVNDCSTKEAAQFLNGSTVPLESDAPKQSAAERGFRPLDYLQSDHPMVMALGFDEIAEEVGLGYAPRGLMRGKIAVPIRTPDGTLIGYLGVEDCQVPPSWHL